MKFWKNRHKENNDDDEAMLTTKTHRSPPINQAVELGTVNYVNLTSDSKHGTYDIAIQLAKETGKPIFANFVEWSG